MFDLERAIADWRSQMSKAGVTSQKILNELEMHLREDIELQTRDGLDAQQAFVRSIIRFGRADRLQLEFAKAGTNIAVMDRARLLFSLILITAIVWLSGFTFTRLGFGSIEWFAAASAVVSCLIVAGFWRRAVHYLPAIPNRPKRYAIETILFVSGFICSSLFCSFILPFFERHLNDKIVPAIWLWAVFPIAVFLGLACGLEEAVRNESPTTKATTS